MRIGLVDPSSTHAAAFIEWLAAHPDAGEVVAVAEPNGVEVAGAEVVALGELAGRVDAVAVFSRDGREHARQVLPLVEAGLTVFVDKPLATRRADAEALVAQADACGARLTSFSALRFHPGLDGLRGHVDELHVSGPADPESPWAGLAFYGIHSIEIACELMPGAIEGIEVVDAYAQAHLGGRPVQIALRPDAASFHLRATSSGEAIERELMIEPGYYTPACEAIAAFFAGDDVVSGAELLRPVVLLEALLS